MVRSLELQQRFETASGRLPECMGPAQSIDRSAPCCRPDCARPCVTSLSADRFCFDHFFERCYELLERIDASARSGAAVPSPAEHIFVLHECARRVLELSLGSTALSNLERARLLDILVWSGDLAASIRPKSSASAPAPARPDRAR